MADNNYGVEKIVDTFTTLRATTSDEDWQDLLEKLNAIEKPETGGAVTGDSRRNLSAAEAEFNKRFPDAARIGPSMSFGVRSKSPVVVNTAAAEREFLERFPEANRLK